MYKNCLIISLILLIFTSCNKSENLNKKYPYNQLVNKTFALQKDFYIYKVEELNHIYIGEFFALPQQVDKKYIGFEDSYIKILGIAKAGQLIQVKKIIEEYAFLAGTFDYFYVDLIDSDFHELDANGLVNIFNNPPFTKTWSDPPIFKPEVALPLASDGVWWK